MPFSPHYSIFNHKTEGKQLWKDTTASSLFDIIQVCVNAYPARDLIVLRIKECGIDIHTLNVLYPATQTFELYYYLQDVFYLNI